METFVAEFTLSIAQAIIAEAISHARDLKLKPLPSWCLTPAVR
jgi:hypothetical protein